LSLLLGLLDVEQGSKATQVDQSELSCAHARHAHSPFSIRTGIWSAGHKDLDGPTRPERWSSLHRRNTSLNEARSGHAARISHMINRDPENRSRGRPCLFNIVSLEPRGKMNPVGLRERSGGRLQRLI
jgi:hypothetical protein